MSQIHIAIYGRVFNASVNPYVEQLFDYLRQKDVKISIHQEFYDFLNTICLCPEGLPTFHSYHDFPRDVDFMLSLGGDGTMLSAVSIVRDSNIPIAGINFGRLGFLANIPKTEIEDALQQILDGNYHTQERALLSVSAKDSTLFDGENFALNDITVLRFDSSSMMTVNARLHGELLNSYWSDGLIIATPTGSTAYSLSPHNLNVRPIVVSEDMRLTLNIESRSENFILSCDSRSQALPISTELTIEQAPFKIKLMRLENDGYFRTLREKLLWGIDVRNY
jgi:NAD+ kinase